MNIAGLVDQLGEAFVTVGIVALILTVVFGLNVAGSENSSFMDAIQTEVQDGMVTIASVIVVFAVIIILRVLRNR